MEAFLLLCRLLLAGVLILAGLTKLADPGGSRRALLSFGAPAVLAAPLALMLPLAELAVGLALLPAATAWWGAVGALALLLVFAVGVAVNLARGRTPDCHCFGQLHSRPVSGGILLRNIGLAALAGLVVGYGGRGADVSAVAWLAGWSTPAYLSLVGAVLLATAVGLQGWLLLRLLRQNGQLLLRVEALEGHLGLAEIPRLPITAVSPAAGLPVGTPAPELALADLAGATVTLADLRRSGKPVLLLFADPDCGPCNDLLPEVAAWQSAHAARLSIAIVSRGSYETNGRKAKEHQLSNLLVQTDREAAEAYGAPATPSAVLIDVQGAVAEPAALGPAAIRRLVARVTRSPELVHRLLATRLPVRTARRNGHAAAAPAPSPAIEPGEPIPAANLRSLDGEAVELNRFWGSRTVLLFWNPRCRFCRAMLDDLKAWESLPPHDAPRLLLISTGRAADHAALQLRSTVILDEQFTLGRSVGARGTPAAIVVDEDGKMASPVAAGATDVLALMGLEDRAGRPAA
jgi:peroxiredoxin